MLLRTPCRNHPYAIQTQSHIPQAELATRTFNTEQKAMHTTPVTTTYCTTATCTAHLGDWRDVLPHVPSATVDLTLTSPPYCLGKSYDTGQTVDDFESEIRQIIPHVIRVTKPGGSICWQVGHYVRDNILTPLDYISHNVFSEFDDLDLRNRIIWTFNSGLHCTKRFSGRHEVVLWYTKCGASHYFDVDPVRIPQRYPGKKHHKGPNKGQFSGNPLGKNPGDVWDIPNVRGQSIEKTNHPCQFPVGLAQGLVMSLSPPMGLVLDPYMGSGTTGVAAILEQRRFVGTEIASEYHRVAIERLTDAMEGRAKFRPYGKPILTPSGPLSEPPDHFTCHIMSDSDAPF